MQAFDIQTSIEEHRKTLLYIGIAIFALIIFGIFFLIRYIQNPAGERGRIILDPKILESITPKTSEKPSKDVLRSIAPKNDTKPTEEVLKSIAPIK